MQLVYEKNPPTEIRPITQQHLILSPGRPEGDYQQAVEIYRIRARPQLLLKYSSFQNSRTSATMCSMSQAQVREEGYMSWDCKQVRLAIRFVPRKNPLL